MKDTYFPSKKFIVKKWFIIDATDKTLGRLATKISKILVGKEKASYTPFLDNGDNIIIINAEKISLTGKKELQKEYKNHSGQPGGMRVEILAKLRRRKPEKIIEHAVKGMLPKGSLGRQIYTNLKVYHGSVHPHQAQRPELLNI
jgi:large subunit ribosomal protein L13